MESSTSPMQALEQLEVMADEVRAAIQKPPARELCDGLGCMIHDTSMPRSPPGSRHDPQTSFLGLVRGGDVSWKMTGIRDLWQDAWLGATPEDLSSIPLRSR